MSCYVLDTSAVLAYIENEPGAKDIDRLLRETLDRQHTLSISVITGIEVFYITYREQGIAIAPKRLQLLEDLPLIQEPVRREAVECIGTIKATHTLQAIEVVTNRNKGLVAFFHDACHV